MRVWVYCAAVTLFFATATHAQQPVATGTESSSPVGIGATRSSDFPADNIASPSPGMGQVIFFRKGGMVGAAISCAVHEGEAKLTSLPPGHFAVVQVVPGVHTFLVKSEASDSIRVDIQQGQTLYASCHPTMGIVAGRPKLEMSDKATFFAIGHKLKPVAQ